MENAVPERVRTYLTHGLAATPHTMTALLAGVPEAALDARPDPDRFTLREVICHMADWDGVWRERLVKIATEDEPVLPGYDEGQWAIDHDYAHQDVAAQLTRLAAARAELVAYLRSVDTPTWQRLGRHGEIGPVTFLELASLVLGHDGYHVQQILDYRGLGRTAGA